MAVLSLSKEYSDDALEAACERLVTFGITPTFKSVQNLLVSSFAKTKEPEEKPRGITRGADYYRRGND